MFIAITAFAQQRIGLTGAPMPLALRDAMLLALENNRDIEIERANLDFSRAGLLRARGAFDPIWSSGPLFRSEKLPVASVLAGGPTGTLSQESAAWNSELGQLTPWGGRYRVAFDNLRFTTSNVFTQLSPQLSTGLSVNFTQPLLRGLTLDEPRRQLRLRSKDIEISQAQFRQRVIDVVTSVQHAYWDLAQARQQAEVTEEAVRLGQEQLDTTKRQVDAGTVAKIEIVSAEAELSRRRGEYLAAVERVTVAENTLKQMIARGRTDPVWSRELVPSQTEAAAAPITVLDEAVRAAIGRRPEVESVERQIEQNQVDVSFFRQQLKPQLDLVVNYGRRGLAGLERGGDNPFSAQNVALASRVNELSQRSGLPALPAQPSQALPAFFSGGWGTSLGNMFDHDFRVAEVGVVFRFPFKNREAEGDLARANAAARRLNASRDRVEQAIEADVRNALQAVETARQRLEAARAARTASRERLESESRLFRVGETTNFFVLTRQNEYSAARAAEVRALSDLNRAISNLRRALGETMEAEGLAVK